MYYLEQKQFKPAMILCGILFIPAIIALMLLNILSFQIQLLIILISFVLIYMLVVWIFWKISKNKDFYFRVKHQTIELVYHGTFTKNAKIKLELSFDQIKKIEYYRITSLTSWFLLSLGVFPKAVYITYDTDEKEITCFVGYMDLKDVKQVAINTGIILQMH